MREGAVAVLDALGFKGIWRGNRVDDQSILQSLTHIRDLTNALVVTIKQSKVGEIPIADYQIRFFSDTVIISSVTSGGDPLVDAPCWSIIEAGIVVSVFLGFASLLGKPPMTYRGAISYGEFENRDDFWIGPAIDEAAAAERLAEAAIVWLCPSALRIVERVTAGASELEARRLFELWPLTRDYLVPLKRLQNYRTHAVDPFRYQDPEDDEKLVEAMLHRFDESCEVGVAVKKQNSENFLRFAQKQRRSIAT